MRLQKVFFFLFAGGLAACKQQADSNSVREVIAQFSEATIDHDFTKMTNSFAKDAIWEATGEGLAFRLEGIEAIRSAFVKNDSIVDVTFQQTGIPVVKITSKDRATSLTSVTELLRFKATGVVTQVMGFYRDDLIYDGKKWIFVHRRFELRQSLEMKDAK